MVSRLFRKAIFWIHLCCGVIAGLVIAIMSATGVVLAFEKQCVAWAERDARRVEAPAEGTPRREVDGLLAEARRLRPDLRFTAITVYRDPSAAVALAAGRDTTYYADPYRGEVRQPASTRMHDFMHVMEDWHRWLGQNGDQRAAGRAITGACNLAFLVLGVTGLYLWWPHSFSWRGLKPSLWFIRARGKARDWNWHNVIGFWSLPVLIVLTASGVVMSYRWANQLVYSLAGETAPPPGPPGQGGPTVDVAPPSPDARPLSWDQLLLAVQEARPEWDSITLRLGAGPRNAGASTPPAARAERAASTAGPAERSSPAAPRRPAASVVVRAIDPAPRFVSSTLWLDPFNGSVLKQEEFRDATPGRRARMWLRFLHTGEAFGPTGQAVAGLASLGGVILVWTGIALAVRRLAAFRRNRVRASAH